MCLLVSLTSCEKDEVGDDSDLIGTWGLTHEKEIREGKTSEKNYDIEDDVYTFMKNGTVRHYGYYTNSYGEKELDYDRYGEWELKGNTLIFYDEDKEREEYRVSKLTSKKLILVYEDENEYGELTYTKVD